MWEKILYASLSEMHRHRIRLFTFLYNETRMPLLGKYILKRQGGEDN